MTEPITLPSVDFSETERLRRIRDLRTQQEDRQKALEAQDDRYFELEPMETRSEMEQRVFDDPTAWSPM